MSSKLNVRELRLALVAALACTCLVAPAREAIERSSLTNFDLRIAAPKAIGNAKRGTPNAAQRDAGEKLKQRVPDVVINFDPILGTPKWVQSRGSFLTGPRGEGRAVSPQTAKRFERDPDKALKSFLQEHEALFRHGPEILDAATKKRDHTTEHGLRTAVWEQQVDGIPVFESVFVAHTSAKGELISLSSQFVPAAEAAATRGTPKRAAQIQAPLISATQALRIAAANVGEEAGELSAIDPKPAAQTLKQRFKIKSLPGEAGVNLVWLPLDGDTLRLCWQVELNRQEFSERFRFLVDAESGEVWLRRKLTVEVSEVLYRVFTADSPSPFSPGHPVPTNIQPPMVERQLVSISNINATASPLGWLNDGVMETRGNNVDARLDRDGDDRADLPRVQGTTNASGQRVFDFPIDFGQHPTNYAAASTVQLFYWCNWMHDKLYELGFTESAGNFQKDNFGRGGSDNDAILADAQDGSGVNNANFTPAGDGAPGRIQMYVFSGPTPARDGDLDAEVILHEYAHGLSDRLIGGGVGISQLQTYGMGEGWSDFFAEALLSEFEDDLGGNTAMGGYVTYLFNGLTQNYYYGIRRYPYSTNLNVDPLTFKDIDPQRMSFHPGIPKNPIITSTSSEVHRQGEVWCSMLWDMRASLLTKYAPTNAESFTNANMRVLRYVTLGLQLSPPNPNFAQARDAILLAARALPGSGDDTNEIWAAFARRGLGVSAICPENYTTVGVTEAFDTPARPVFDVQPNQPFLVIAGTVGGPFSPTAITNTLINSSTSNLNWAASVSVPWLSLSASNGILTPNTPVENVVALTSIANGLPADSYQGSLFYTNVSRTQVVSRLITLVVQTVEQGSLGLFPSDTTTFQGPEGGPFDSELTYLLSNNGASPLEWIAFTTNNWLSIDPTNGTLAAKPDFANVKVTVNTNAASLANGNHYGAVTFLSTSNGARIDAPILLRVGRTNFLTEEFFSGRFDLQFSTLTFTPDFSDSYYRVCREPAVQFPTDPTGGTPLNLDDDAYQQIALTDGQQVSIFGVSSNAVYIGANGNLTFDPVISTAAFFPGIGNYFAAMRASALYVDLNPKQAGVISYLQLSDRLAVTYENVPEYVTPGDPTPNNNNTFQIEMFFDGAIRMTWLNIDATTAASITGLSRGTGEPADYVPSDLSSSGSCFPLANLIIPSTVTEGANFAGLVVLSVPLAEELTVTLSSSDTNVLSLETNTVVIPAGQTSYEFGIEAIPDLVPDGSQLAYITASFPDRPSVKATVTVDDAQTGILTVNVQSSGREGDVLIGAGEVTADVVASVPIRVNLLSDNPHLVQVPPMVIIPPGQSSAKFDIVLVDNGVLDGTGTNLVVIEAFIANWSGDFDAIRVTDNESRALTLTLPAEATEGQGTLINAGTVSLGGIAATNVPIALRSEPPGLVIVPAFVTNLSGLTNVKFDVTIGDNSVTNAFDGVRIVASVAGFISATGTITIVDNERPFAPFNPLPADFATHVPRDTTLSWTPNSSAPPGTMYDVYFGTDTNQFDFGPVESTTGHSVSLFLADHLDPDTTYYWKVVAKLAPFPSVESAVWQFTTATLGFGINPIASPQFTDEAFPVVVSARDEFGLPVSNFVGSVTLTNSAPVKSTSSIVITEFDTAGFARIEFANVSGRSLNIAGWQIAVYDFTHWPEPSVVITIPGPSVSAPGELFFLRSLPLQFFPGRYPNFATGTNVVWSNNANNNPVAVLLRDNVGNIVDFVCAVDADPSLISTPITIPTEQWSGPPVRANLDTALTYQRRGSSESNRSNDWVIAGRNLGTNNIGLIVPFSSSQPVAFTATPLNSFFGGVCTGLVTMLDQARSLTFGVRGAQDPAAQSNPIDVFSRNDLGLSVAASEFVLVNEPITYQFTVTNIGPAIATGITFVDVLSTNSSFASAVPSQGACSFSNGTVTCELGALPADTVATVTVTALALGRGVATNFAAITRSEVDAYAPNNSVSSVTAVSFPQLSILDVTNSEPNNGTASMTFTLRLSAPNILTSSVAYATSDNTALGGIDYQPTSGVVTFPPGTTNLTVSVLLNGDLLNEANETFFVVLSDPANLDITKSMAVGMIADNDPLPQLTVGDVTVTEDDLGGAVAAFPLRLGLPSGRTVTVAYSTANGTALAGLDYVESYGSVVFQPGVTNMIVNVPLLGDTVPEPAKTFFLNAVSAGNVIVFRSPGVCTILDNDPAGLEGFIFAPMATPKHAGPPLPVTITALDGDGSIASDFNDAVTLLALDNEHTVTIASNTSSWGLPLGTSFHDSRLQSIYLTNEIGGPGRITGLALDVTTAPGQALSNWTIRLRHTANDHYFAGSWESLNWTTAFQHDVSLVTTGWVKFHFATPFLYNGRNNLMVDFSFNNSSFSSDGVCRSFATPLMRSIYLRTDSAYGDPLDWIGANPQGIMAARVPGVQFLMDREIPMEPAAVSNFVNGVWTGTVTLRGGGTNVVLRAVDPAGRHGESNPFVMVLLRISNITHDGNSVTLSFETVAGNRYVVESRTTLADTWTPISAELFGAGGVEQFTHTPGGQQQFYRVRLVPQ